MSFITQLPFEDLTTLVYGGSALWLLLYLCGQFGAFAERFAARRESVTETPSAGVAPPAARSRCAELGSPEQPRTAR